MRGVLTRAELQRLRSLREKKNREALGLFVIEGEKVIRELLAAEFPFAEIYGTPEWLAHDPAALRATHAQPQANLAAFRPPQTESSSTAEANALRDHSTTISVREISVEEMARASHFPTPSTVLAVGRIVRPALHPDELAHGFTLALDGVQDPGNVGTLLRIADWFAFDRVVLSPDCADVFHQKVINASMGSFARVRAHTSDLADAFIAARTASPELSILGCDLEGESVHTLPPLRDAIVVIGSEGRGLSPAVAAHVTRRITIPRHGRAESLNAAIAAAIVCDNLRRVR
jgi:TrmH family RNA methyltransferase